MHSPTWVVAAALWPALAASYAIRNIGLANEMGDNTTPMAASPLLVERDDSPLVDLAFIERWAAIGDSFTAGIGSGKRMGLPTFHRDDWRCSRYTYTWPHIVDRAIGSSRKTFAYTACSGARSEDIYQQAQNLDGDLDLVMLTAGGNDLCLAAMIRKCVMLPYDGESACMELINKAQENIDTILKDNIRSILDALKPKMKQGGIVIYNSYAPFFNTDNEDCADPSKQKWALPWLSWASPLRLTVDRRNKFNMLVNNINKAIREVVKEFQEDRKKSYDIEFSDWSDWPAEVDGQMCSPRSDGSYPDPKQPELQYFKGNTWVWKSSGHDGLKRRELVADDDDNGDNPYHDDRVRRESPERINMYDSLLYKSPDPRAVALHKLDPRAPLPPNCPGDGAFDPTFGLGLPDTFGMLFHPNQRGHETIASFALQNLAYAKAKQYGKEGDLCQIKPDDFVCWRQKEGRKAFVSWERLDVNYKDFCDSVKPPANTVNWRWDKTYHEKTPEEVQFVVQLSDGAFSFDPKLCKESMDRIINSCDGNDIANPMNRKFGGKYVRGGYRYEINPKKDRQLLTHTDGSCQGWYKWYFSSYTIYGYGWAGWDYGQETLLPNARRCIGGGLTAWEFEYYDKPEDHNGWEWRAYFRTPIWVNARCFDNLRVQGGSGGYTHKWKENASDERYEDYGCTGSG